jgi:hypothetical protein
MVIMVELEVAIDVRRRMLDVIDGEDDSDTMKKLKNRFDSYQCVWHIC